MSNIKFKDNTDNIIKINHPVKFFNLENDSYTDLGCGYYVFNYLGGMVSKVRKLDPKVTTHIDTLDNIFVNISMDTFNDFLSNASVAYIGEVRGKIRNKCKIIVKIDISSSEIKFDTSILNPYTISCDCVNDSILLYLDKGINFFYNINTNDLTSLDNQPLDCTEVISSCSIISLLDGVTKGNNVKKL